MGDLKENKELLDDIVDNILCTLDAALDHPIQKTSSGVTNDLEHLIDEFALDENAEEKFTQLIEGILQESKQQLVPGSADDLNSSPVLKEQHALFSAADSFAKSLSNENNITGCSIPSLPSINSENNTREAEPSDLQAAERHIQGLEAHGPAGLAHISALGHVVNRRIQVWTSSMNLYQNVGKSRDGEPLNVQYHSQPEEIQGHWTLLGNEDPDQIEADLNDCLFAAIAAQTGRKPSELRTATIDRMRNNIKSLANRIQALARQEECGRIVLMIGGARYTGSSPRDAQWILDRSQEGTCHPRYMQGHPRGHASHPPASGPTQSAENYSRGGWKTGFLSRQDQDTVGHKALSTSEAQRAMAQLNAGAHNQAVNILASQLSGPLPPGAHFNNGAIGSVHPIRELVLVLRHHTGHETDPDHEVFVHTFYPVLER